MNAKRILRWVMTLGLLALMPSVVTAGGLKGKIQQKLNAPSNVQYEPYYLETTYQTGEANRQDLPMDRQQAMPVAASRLCDRKDRSDMDNLMLAKRIAPPAPVLSSSAIYNVNYTAELEENVVTVKGKITFEVFKKDGWTQLPLVSNKVGLIDVKVNKGKSFVVNQGDKYVLMIDRAGRYELDMEFLLKASREREGGPGSFSVDVIPAPISQFEFSMPEENVQIFVDPAIKVELTQEKDKTTAWAVMPNTNSLNVRWTKALPKEEIVSVKLEPKVFAESHTQAMVGGGVISCHSQLNYSILQSEVSSLRIFMPEKVSVLNVSGADLRDWKVTPKDGGQYLDVFFNFGVKGNYLLNLEYERSINEDSQIVEMPWVKPLGVERENGYYGVGASTNVELAIKSLDKVTEIDTKQLPTDMWNRSANPILLAFKYLNHPIHIAIEMTRHQELPVLIASVDSVEYTTLYTKEGKALTKAIYRVRNNVKQFLRLRLPEGAVIWSTFVADKPVKPASDDKGNIIVPLEKSQMQNNTLMQFPVEIVYLEKAKALGFNGKIKMKLPEIDIPANEFFWSLYMPPEYSYFLFDGDMRRMTEYERGMVQTIAQYSVGGLMRRGVQGRLRSAADDIGEQYSAGNTSQQGYWSSSQQVAVMEKEALNKGLLPIKIEVPQVGKLLRFQKMLVVEGESPHMQFRYTRAFIKLQKLLKWIFWGVVIFLVVRAIGRRRTKKLAAH